VRFTSRHCVTTSRYDLFIFALSTPLSHRSEYPRTSRRVEISWHGFFRGNFLNYVTSPESISPSRVRFFPHLHLSCCTERSGGARSSANDNITDAVLARPRIPLRSLLAPRHRCTPRRKPPLSAPGLRDRNNGRYGECNARASTETFSATVSQHLGPG